MSGGDGICVLKQLLQHRLEIQQDRVMSPCVSSAMQGVGAVADGMVKCTLGAFAQFAVRLLSVPP